MALLKGRFRVGCRQTGNYRLGVCAIPFLNSEFPVRKHSHASALKGGSDRADIQWSRGERDLAAGLPLKFPALTADETRRRRGQVMSSNLLDNPKLFRHVVEDLPVGIYIVDRERRIRFWNRGAEHLIGHLAHDVVGHVLEDVVRLRPAGQQVEWRALSGDDDPQPAAAAALQRFLSAQKWALCGGETGQAGHGKAQSGVAKEYPKHHRSR